MFYVVFDQPKGKRLAEFGVEDASIIEGGEIGELPAKPHRSREKSRGNQLETISHWEQIPVGTLS